MSEGEGGRQREWEGEGGREGEGGEILVPRRF